MEKKSNTNDTALLTVGPELFKELISNSVLVYFKDDTYKLHIAKNNRSNLDFVIVRIDKSLSESEEGAKVLEEMKDKVGAKAPKEIEELYREYMSAFPTDGNRYMGIEGEGISFRLGKKEKIKISLKARLAEGFSAEEIVQAVKYNFWYKWQECVKFNDYTKLSFVKRSESWINDTANLQTMIERSKLSDGFKKYLLKTENANTGTEIGHSYKPKFL